jgi:hypothetical protein
MNKKEREILSKITTLVNELIGDSKVAPIKNKVVKTEEPEPISGRFTNSKRRVRFTKEEVKRAGFKPGQLLSLYRDRRNNKYVVTEYGQYISDRLYKEIRDVRVESRGALRLVPPDGLTFYLVDVEEGELSVK